MRENRMLDVVAKALETAQRRIAELEARNKDLAQGGSTATALVEQLRSSLKQAQQDLEGQKRLTAQVGNAVKAAERKAESIERAWIEDKARLLSEATLAIEEQRMSPRECEACRLATSWRIERIQKAVDPGPDCSGDLRVAFADPSGAIHLVDLPAAEAWRAFAAVLGTPSTPNQIRK